MRRPSVLLVEDSPMQITLVRHVLEPHAELTVAETTSRARMLLAEHDYDLVVLDLFLPDGNGLDVLRDLNNIRPDVRIVVKSGAAAPQIVDEALALGAEAVLEKQGHPERLLAFLDLDDS